MAHFRKIAAGLALISIALPVSAVAAASVQKPAAIVAYPQHAPMLAAAHAGHRIVAVGDHGVILLSDDDGAAFRQARAVPTQALLDSVFFVDARVGWVAGHDGVIMRSNDGGEPGRCNTRISTAIIRCSRSISSMRGVVSRWDCSVPPCAPATVVKPGRHSGCKPGTARIATCIRFSAAITMRFLSPPKLD